MPDPCVQFQEHAWKKGVCVNCLRSRANHPTGNHSYKNVPQPSKRNSRANMDAAPTGKPAITAAKPDITSAKPVNTAGRKTNGAGTKPTKVEKDKENNKDISEADVKDSIAKLMTSPSPTPKHERLQRNGSSSSVYMRGFPDLAKLKSSPGSPSKATSSDTPRSPSMDSTTSTVSTASTMSMSGGERRSSMDLLKSGDNTDKVASKIEKAREKRAQKLTGGKGSRPHVPPPSAPPPAAPGKDKNKSSGGHYYHQYDLGMSGLSGTPASTLEKAKKLKAKKEAEDQLLDEVHVAMPYTVVDVSANVPRDDRAPKLPACPAPDKMDSIRSTTSAKKYNGKLETNFSHLHNKPQEPSKKIEEVLPAAREFDFIDDGTNPSLPVLIRDEDDAGGTSPSPPRKVPIMIQPTRPCNTYEPIDGEDLLNGETGSFTRQDARTSSARSVTFSSEESQAPKRQEKARKSGGKSFFKKLLGFGSKDNGNDQSSCNSLDNSVDDDLNSSQDNLDSVSDSKPKKKPAVEKKPAADKKPAAEKRPAPEKRPSVEKKPSVEKRPTAGAEKSVSFGFTSEWAEALRSATGPDSPGSPVSPARGAFGGQEPPVSPKLDMNLSPGAKRAPALSKELEIDTSFIDKVMQDTSGAGKLSPGIRGAGPVSPRGPVSPNGPVSPSGRSVKPVRHPGVPPPPAPAARAPPPKLNSEHSPSSQVKPSLKRVSINVNDLKCAEKNLLEAAERAPPKTVNIETDHSASILGDALEEPVYEIGNLKDELSSLLEGFGKSFGGDEKMDILSSPPEQKRHVEPVNSEVTSAGASSMLSNAASSNPMTDSMMSTASMTSGGGTLTRRRSRSKGDGQRASVSRMSMAPPPPPPEGKRTSQPNSPSHEPSSTPFSRKGIEISGPIPGSQVFTHCTLPRKHKPVRALSSPDDRKISVDDWVCTRNRRMNVADKHARNKTVTEGVDLQAIQDWNTNNLGSRTQSDDRFGDLFNSRFMNRALPPTPKVPTPDIAEESHGENDSVTENVYELVPGSVGGSSGRGAYEDIDETDIYSDPVDACPVPKAEEEEDSNLLSRCLSNDYLEPVNHEDTLDKNLKPALKNKQRSVNFEYNDLGGGNKSNVSSNGIYSSTKPHAQPRSCVKKADVRLSGEHYVDVYANTDALLDKDRQALTYKEGFNKMAVMNIETLQKLADSIYFRFIPKDPNYLGELKWRDFSLRNKDIELIQGMYGYYRVRCPRIRPHDCYIIVCAKSLKLGLLDFCHANVLSPFALFTDHISADYFPESVNLPHAYQLYGLEQTNIACLNYSGMVSFREYWDAKYTEMSSFTPIAYERLIANHMAQVLNGLLHVRDQGCVIRRLEVDYVMVVTSGVGDEEHPVINPAQWDFDDMLDIDPEPLCLDIVALLLTMFRIDPSTTPLTNFLSAIPAKTKYSQGFHRLLTLLTSHSWESIIQARDMMEFVLWGPEEEEWKTLLAADDPIQAFNVWLEVARSQQVAQFAVQRPPPTVEVANKLRAFCALTGVALRDSAKLLRS